MLCQTMYNTEEKGYIFQNWNKKKMKNKKQTGTQTPRYNVNEERQMLRTELDSSITSIIPALYLN